MRKHLQKYGPMLAATLLLLVVALYNGFPLTESDTGAYIEAGIKNVIPKDRSPFYGWFIRYSSGWSSLWYTVLVQSALTAWLLLRCMSVLAGRLQRRWQYVAIVAIVSFTCAAWVTAYLMPDIFAAILLLSVLLLFIDRSAGTAMQVIYVVVALAATVIHNSHAPILMGYALASAAVWAATKRWRLLWKSLILGLTAISSWAIVCYSNEVNGYGFTFSRGSHVFMVTKLAESGILSAYLHDECNTKNLQLCAYKDEIPDYSWEFMWNENSPLYKTGGWDSSEKEYNLIIHDVLTTPKYLGLYVTNAAASTMRELTQVQAPDHTSLQGDWSSPWQRVRTFYEDEFGEYVHSEQYKSGLEGGLASAVYMLFFVLSTIWLLLHHKLLTEQDRMAYMAVILFLVVNAFVTSVGSTVIYRFQYRVFWILPAMNIMLIVRHYAGINKEAEFNVKG